MNKKKPFHISVKDFSRDVEPWQYHCDFKTVESSVPSFVIKNATIVNIIECERDNKVDCFVVVRLQPVGVMQREVVFRGKSLVDGLFVYCGISDHFPHPVDWSTVGQYIGRKDKHGEELYEGDIILVNGRVRKVIQYRPELTGFAMANEDELNQEMYYPWAEIRNDWWNAFKRDIELVGNIYNVGNYEEQKSERVS